MFIWLQLFLIDPCPNNDKLVLNCFNDIIIDFISSNEISCQGIRGIENFYLFNGIKYLLISKGT